MVISGWVVTLNEGVLGDQAEAQLRQRPGLDIGVRQGFCLPVVAETPGLEDGERLAKEVEQVDGVTLVDVLSIDFSDGYLEQEVRS